MAYNPDIHDRKSIRLKEYDYAQAGAYFVTMVTQHKAHLFGDIVQGEMNLNDAGRELELAWHNLANRFSHVILDEHIVMPNHIHGIIFLLSVEGEHKVRPYKSRTGEPRVRPTAHAKPEGTEPNTLGRIIQAFKSITTHRYIQGVKESNWPTFDKRLWHRNYFERIIRTDSELANVRSYIQNNPLNWNHDQENPHHV